jgi:HSP20 family protein
MPLCQPYCNGTKIDNTCCKIKLMLNLIIKEDKAMLPMITRRSYKPFLWSGLFDDDFFPVLSQRNTSMPAVNIREDDKRFTLDLAVPGIEKKDLKIEINEDVLTISSEHKEEKEENLDDFKRREFSYSSFCRSFYLPENVNKEKIEGNYKDGILTITLPKAEEEKAKLSRQVKIS